MASKWAREAVIDAYKSDKKLGKSRSRRDGLTELGRKYANKSPFDHQNWIASQEHNSLFPMHRGEPTDNLRKK